MIDPLPQIRARPRPLRLLDDAAIHVGDVHRPVRRGGDVDRAEQRIRRADELGERVDVPELREPFALHRMEAADDARDDLAVEVVAHQVLGQAIAAIHVVAGGAGGAGQRAVGHAHGVHAALHVGDEHRRAPGDVEVGLELLGIGEVAVLDGRLEVPGHAAGAGLEPHLAVVVHGHAPLPAVRAGGLAQHAAGRPLQADRIDGAVDPVVEPPGEAALLVLDVHHPAHAGGEQFFLVGDVVVVGVGVFPDLVGVRLLREDGVAAERHHEAREHQLVDEDVMRLVDAVAVLVFVQRDARDGVERSAAIGILHVAADLEHEHAAVAVEGDLRRLLDVGIRQHRFELEARRQPEPLRLLRRRQRLDRRLLRKVRFPHRRAAAAGAAAAGGIGRRRWLPLRCTRGRRACGRRLRWVWGCGGGSGRRGRE